MNTPCLAAPQGLLSHSPCSNCGWFQVKQQQKPQGRTREAPRRAERCLAVSRHRKHRVAACTVSSPGCPRQGTTRPHTSVSSTGVHASWHSPSPPPPSCRGSQADVAAVSCCLCTEVGFPGLEEALAPGSEAPHTRPGVRSCQPPNPSTATSGAPAGPVYLGLLQGPPDSPPTSLLSLLLGVQGDF